MRNTDWITTDDLLGKKVIDVEGAQLGIVDKIFVDKNIIEMVAFSIDKGFLQKGLVIGKDYVSKVTEHAIFLNVKPAIGIKGLPVYDSKGVSVGTVSDVQLQDSKNKIEQLRVKTKKIVGTDEIRISRKFIGEIDKSVMLTVTLDELRGK